MKTNDFLDNLYKVSLDKHENRIYVERGIQLIEWEGNISQEEKKRLDNLKILLTVSTKNKLEK